MRRRRLRAACSRVSSRDEVQDRPLVLGPRRRRRADVQPHALLGHVQGEGGPLDPAGLLEDAAPPVELERGARRDVLVLEGLDRVGQPRGEVVVVRLALPRRLHRADVVLQDAPDALEGGDVLVHRGDGADAVRVHDGLDKRRLLEAPSQLGEVVLVVRERTDPIKRRVWQPPRLRVEGQELHRLLERRAPPMRHEPLWNLLLGRHKLREGALELAGQRHDKVVANDVEVDEIPSDPGPVSVRIGNLNAPNDVLHEFRQLVEL
mmetsp:Transcript_37191/g.104961  ORF Transcript_37191/g.104961 Transcript_37191/m.104961 type:complete len:263 (-) Transcript_37191:496-1284(-)